MTKFCKRLECKAENPINAKFCRKCGAKLDFNIFDIVIYKIRSCVSRIMFQRISQEFTPDKFPTVDLTPVSVKPVDFINKFWFVFGGFLALAIVTFYNSYHVEYFLKDNLGESDYYQLYDLMPLSIILLAVIILYLIFSLNRKFLFRFNADYIEGDFVKPLVRIAKKGKLGLFDMRNKKVRLLSRYDSIEKFDNNHLLIGKSGKKGLYSIPRKKIIIPVSFDSISTFTNSVCAATDNGITVHYDVKGNRLQ